MYSRSLHKKSRNGCGRCKKRRVKCDFRAPICSNCERREEKCDYEAIYNNDLNFRRDSSASTESSLSLVQSTTIPKVLSISIYFQPQPGVLISLVNGIGHNPKWDPQIVQEIGKHEFLQHAFLALSTLYEKQSSSSITKADLATACEHHIQASSLFRQSAPALKESEWVATLAFAMTVVIFQLRITTIQANKDCMAETMLILRSGANSARSVAPHFMAERSLRNRELRATPMPLDPHMLYAFENLERLVSEYNWVENFEKVYEQPVQALKQWLNMTQGQPRTWLHFIWWPSSIDPKYIYLLAQKDPVAIIIFLHWCTVMVNAPPRWFLNGWAATMAMQASDSVDVQWMPAVSWPSLVFVAESDMLLAQSSGEDSE